MRLNINLASQPYEVAQTYRQRMTLVITALSVVAALLVGYIVYQRQYSRGIDQQLSDVQRQIQALDNEESQARAILNKPANRVVADQSDFLNQLFARKSLSWTRLFTEMEKIVPPGLHVVSMKPEYTKTNDVVLHVVVATDSRERAVELVRHMEKSTHLRQAQIVAETVTNNTSDQTAGGNIQFDIAAVYVPSTAETEESPQASGEAEPPKPLRPPVTGVKPTSAPMNQPASAPPGLRPAPNMNVATSTRAAAAPSTPRAAAPSSATAPPVNVPPHLNGVPITSGASMNQEAGNAPALNGLRQPYYGGADTQEDQGNAAVNGMQPWPRRPGVRQH